MGEIQRGQKLLINGAGGGVGTFALQLVQSRGVETTGVDSSGKLEMLRSLGCNQVIDYTREDFTRKGQRYDLILDVRTTRSIFDYARALHPGGIYVTIGGPMARLLRILLLGPLLSLIAKKHFRIVALKPNKDLAYVNDLFDAGRVRPVIDRTYKLREVPDAMRYFSEGRHKGKVVIIMEHCRD
jgi:NADPH:quinone reductase-like Zn-dependent oxidoreductase